eukprot:jgi/Botrbrau1/16234/Bobra.0066s0020.1
MLPHGSSGMGGILLLLAALTVVAVASFHKDSSTHVQQISETHTHITLRRRTASVSGLPARAQRLSGRVHIQQWHAAAASNSSVLELPLHASAAADPAENLAIKDVERQIAQDKAGTSLPLLGLGDTQDGNDTADAATAGINEDSKSSLDIPELARKFQGWKDQYVALCLAFKDQHADLREWVEHHLALGVTKIYIMDNNSSMPIEPILADYIAAGLVKVDRITSAPPTARPQIFIYDTCLRRYRLLHTFMGFIDTDEFIVLTDPSVPDLPTLLQEYENYGALAVNWQMFGSSGLQTRPHKGALQSYIKCLPEQHKENLHIKSIVNTRLTLGPRGDPHHFRYGPGKFAVNTKFQPVHGARSQTVSTERVILKHYVLKSAEEYKEKINRGSGMKNKKTFEFFNFVEQQATADCPYIQHVYNQA